MCSRSTRWLQKLNKCPVGLDINTSHQAEWIGGSKTEAGGCWRVAHRRRGKEAVGVRLGNRTTLTLYVNHLVPPASFSERNRLTRFLYGWDSLWVHPAEPRRGLGEERPDQHRDKQRPERSLCVPGPYLKPGRKDQYRRPPSPCPRCPPHLHHAHRRARGKTPKD